MDHTIVEYFADNDSGGHRCGYCGGKNTNYSQGMWAHSMTVQDYEDLICRGWRRSGKYCYKPTMQKTCCPHYTIRCLAQNFMLSKSQKNTLKQVHKYFNDGTKSTDSSSKNDLRSKVATSSKSVHKNIEGVESVEVSRKPHNEPIKGAGPDPNKPKCRKAKEIRKEKAMRKHPTLITLKKSNAPAVKSLQDFLSELKPDGAHKLEIKLVRSHPRSEEFKRTFKDAFLVYKKYQTIVHKDETSKVTENQFTRFLIDSPLIPEYNDDGFTSGYGSFHQQYWIDGRLWMVGVIDILPSATSSVYLFYDPDFSFLSPGTYSALREIDFTQQLHSVQPKIYSYMMGYYVHSCPKMKYKGQFHPSHLLCPEANDWHPIEECIPKLDISKYSRFAPPNVRDEEAAIDLDQTLVLHQQMAMPYSTYKMMKSMKIGKCDDESEVTEYARLVGKTCSQRMLVYRD